jgi:membrane-bound lytic murein transglycosylase B
MNPYKLLTLSLLSALFFSAAFFAEVFAQTEPASETAETGECTTKESCQSLLDKYESLLKQFDSDISKTAGEKKTLQNQIAALKKKTDSLAVQIKQSNAMIGDFKMQINDTALSIDETTKKIQTSQKYLATIVRAIDEADKTPLVQTLLSERKLSSFFDNLVYLENLNDKSNEVLQDIKNLKLSLEDQKSGLENEKGDLEKTTVMKELQKKEHELAQAEYNKTLKVKDVELKQTTAAKQLTSQVIQKIKQRMFTLAGVADTDAPNFEQAYQIAKSVGNMTGVRPAFILAILTQESNVGKNVGQCYLQNDKTGVGIKITTGAAMAKVMHPTRDVQPFINIVKALGKDPHATRVSCPMSFGYGGAMGPAQFIPSTWNIYVDRLQGILKRPANPWNINDAFLATALYVSDYGATSQEYSGEWKAAMIYFAGSVNKKYRFYGDSVIKLANGYADDIAAIEGK